jgi:hypothetical protein
MQSLTFHASSIAPWRAAVIHILLCATGLGVLMSVVGAYRLDDDPLLLRTSYLVVLGWVSAILDMLAYGLAMRLRWANPYFWRRVLSATLLVVLPIALLVWSSTWLFGRPLTAMALLLTVANSFVITGAFIAAFVAPPMDTALRRTEADALAAETAQSNPHPANFMERLPAHLRDSQLWALKAEDHYLLVLTSKGEALLRLRLGDALRELTSIDGAQTHRSWWLARNAVHQVRKAEGKVALTLPNGREVPVSRAFAKSLREAGWF